MSPAAPSDDDQHAEPTTALYTVMVCPRRTSRPELPFYPHESTTTGCPLWQRSGLASGYRSDSQVIGALRPPSTTPVSARVPPFDHPRSHHLARTAILRFQAPVVGIGAWIPRLSIWNLTRRHAPQRCSSVASWTSSKFRLVDSRVHRGVPLRLVHTSIR